MSTSNPETRTDLVPVSEPILAGPNLNARNLFAVLRRRKVIFIEAFVVVLALGVLAAKQHKPVYRTQAKLLVPMGTSSVSIIDSSNPISAMLAANQPDTVETQLQELQSAPFQQKAREEAKITPKPGVAPPFATVEQLAGSNTIQITGVGGDPHQVRDFVNKMVDLHLDVTNDMAMGGLKRTTGFVREEKENARKQLDQAVRRLLLFRTRNRVVQLTAEMEARAKEFVSLQSQVRETESNIGTIGGQLEELRAQVEKTPEQIVQETRKANPERAEFETELQKLALDHKRMLRQYTAESSVIVQLDDQMEEVRKQLEEVPKETSTFTQVPNPIRAQLETRIAEADASLRAAQKAHNAASAKFRTHKGIVDTMGPWEVELFRLTQERDSAQSAYVMLADRLRDLEIRGSADLKRARAIEQAALPTAPVDVPLTNNIAVSVILALFAGIVMVFIQELLDDRVSSPTDLERFSTVPAVGHIPLIAEEQPKLVSALPRRGPITESYRALRSSVGFASIDEPLRRLLVTSPSAGDGKSLTSLNLAIAMAMDGKRVLLVDADLRRPSLHHYLKQSAGPGLSEVLVGLKDLDSAVQDTEVENLRFIAAGAIPPNPAELLGSQSFEAFLDDLEERSDIVILDSAPCLPVTDSLLIAGQTDGVVVVVHVRKTRKAALRHAEQLLTRARARIIGVVFNRVQQTEGSYYHYYYADSYYTATEESADGERRNGRRRIRRLPAASRTATRHKSDEG